MKKQRATCTMQAYKKLCTTKLGYISRQLIYFLMLQIEIFDYLFKEKKTLHIFALALTIFLQCYLDFPDNILLQA